MSRPQKMHKPLKGDFTQVINAIADGRGVKLQARAVTPSTDKIVRASAPTPPKKP
jgi:hypothetical protein